MLFKVSAAPFHFWTPDVYEGAPTIFTAFMATVVKTAGFAAIYRILSVSFIGLYDNWRIMLIGITILSLLVGNISAVYQQNFKRMLAFSSISHAGFMLLAILGMSSSSDMSIIFYSFAYSLATISAFGVLMIVSEQALKNGRPNEAIEVFNGLSKQNSFLAVILTIAMLSMAGIPLTAGFWAKFFVFTNAVGRNYAWVLIIAVLMSAVGLYYYFRPILAIYAKKNTGKTMISIPLLYKIILIFTTICTILLGLFPNLLRGLL